MSTLLQPPPRSPSSADVIELQSGDRLDQPTFHRRYARMPSDFHAELVGGVVFVASPATYWHASYHALAITWLGHYQTVTPGVDLLDNGTVILDDQNEPQPDAVLRVLESHGGASRINTEGYLTGAPELHVEVAYSSASLDLHGKRKEYERTGVREYLVLLIREQEIRGFSLAEGRYADHPADADGLWRSRSFPGLWLNVGAFFERRGAALLEFLQQGLKSPEYAQFVATLNPST